MEENKGLLDKQGFDIWAEKYDESVEKCSDEYPFAGYNEVLKFVYDHIENKAGSKILDIGVGTGVLTYRLYRNGARISGIDFSSKMLEIAQERMPEALFIQWDFNHGLPPQLKAERYDYIISSYALHHLDDEKKVELIKNIKGVLKPKGKIVIADVAFESKDARQQCQIAQKEKWDDSEFYLVAEELIPALKFIGINATYTQISSCAGVLEVS